MQKRKLAVLTDPVVAELPTLDEVVYKTPNRDGSRKLCLNCTHWEKEEETCRLMGPGVFAPETAVCSYHLHQGDRVLPQYAGFTHTTTGASCSSCARFNKGAHTCGAVIDSRSGRSALVDPLGFCARWLEDA